MRGMHIDIVTLIRITFIFLALDMQRIPVATHMHAIVSTITYAYPVLKNPIGYLT